MDNGKKFIPILEDVLVAEQMLENILKNTTKSHNKCTAKNFFFFLYFKSFK